MSRLLVSVRSAAEARVALAGGADVIDVKEPAAGPLGRAEPHVWKDVRQAVGGSAELSLALGELWDWSGADRPEATWPEGMRWAKVGLAGAAGWSDWPRHWHDLARRIAPVRLVPVAYADAERAGAPSLLEIIKATQVDPGAAPPAKMLLIDTWKKDQRRLLDWYSLLELAHLRAALAQAGIGLALAGRLRLEDVRQLVPLRPALIAVRGLACGGDRLARVQRDRVAVLRRLCQAGAHANGAAARGA
ncbi:MAG TPA: (5-formylfuran-3-yl)methyl phosphate synthase [Gemmatales bacterium]|nr:(5-formylfuran-3-yl)methyl phosphate synthase [Gemmatales bacterium]HMP60024.1 (5-formylfuran-3-yl)methyl phosphate synthase [Gemmatales bacterium]